MNSDAGVQIICLRQAMGSSTPPDMLTHDIYFNWNNPNYTSDRSCQVCVKQRVTIKEVK